MLPGMAALHSGSARPALASSFPEVCKPSYVSPQVCSEVCGERCSPRLSLLPPPVCPSSATTAPPPSPPASPASPPPPLKPDPAPWVGGACEEPPQADRSQAPGRRCACGAGGGAGTSHHLTGWSGWEASRPPGANEHCRTGVCSSVPSLPCLRPEPAACHPSKAHSHTHTHTRALPRPGPGGRDGLPLLRRWLQQP